MRLFDHRIRYFGKVYHCRERRKCCGVGGGHQYDFLTVSSMGYSPSIALGIALKKPDGKTWCIDGAGALLRHMGAPTVASNIDVTAIAKACGYPNAVSVGDYDSLDSELATAKKREKLSLIEVKCSIGACSNLGRPTVTAMENKIGFTNCLKY